MPAFAYQGVDRHGKSVRGRMNTRDETELEERLRELGLWLVESKSEKAAAKAGPSRGGFGGFGDAGRRELIDFCTLMSFQLEAGIPILTALDVAASDSSNVRFRHVLHDVKRLVEAGESFNEAAARHPKLFSTHFTSLMRAGEQSGQLPATFLELKRYLEWQEQIQADIRQATIYPAFVLGAVVMFVLCLFTFVVPKFVDLLKAARVELPWMTRFVFGISDFLKATWWIWILAVVVLPIASQFLKRRYEKYALMYDRVMFKLPIFGELNHMLVISRLAHNLAVLYRAGISVINALKLCENLVGSVLVGRALEDVGQRVTAGEGISEALRKHPVFPGLLVRMVAMGEKSGTLDASLDNVSTYYNTVIPRRIKKVFGILEPTLILFLVGVVGGVALAVFLPILAMMSAMQR